MSGNKSRIVFLELIFEIFIVFDVVIFETVCIEPCDLAIMTNASGVENVLVGNLSKGDDPLVFLKLIVESLFSLDYLELRVWKEHNLFFILSETPILAFHAYMSDRFVKFA